MFPCAVLSDGETTFDCVPCGGMGKVMPDDNAYDRQGDR